MNRIHSRPSEEALSERYPHYKTYKVCQQSVFLSGSVTLLGVAACTYVIMDHWFKRYRPNVSNNILIAGPLIAGVVAAYAVTMSNTAKCKNMWMAMEERHSVLTPAEERLAERIKSEE
uniref:HIG1 domain-containing protein n=1 Tax=Arion vulgaris TaxID=1028688 RepID=A0A0B6ZLW1_9EUPU